MKKLFMLLVLPVFLFSSSFVFAQSMMRESTETTTDGHTTREEKEGKEIWEKLQAKHVECKNLTNDDFESLGEYVMGQMAGSSHVVMNTMMVRMMGEEGEKQMHIAMGKRNSGCGASFIPMMGSGWSDVMGSWGGFGFLVTLFWIILLVDFILLGVWLWKKIK